MLLSSRRDAITSPETTTDGSTSTYDSGTGIVSVSTRGSSFKGIKTNTAIMHINTKIAKGTMMILLAIRLHLINSTSSKGHILTILINLRWEERTIIAPTAAEKNAEPIAAYNSKLCMPILCSISWITVYDTAHKTMAVNTAMTFVSFLLLKAL